MNIKKAIFSSMYFGGNLAKATDNNNNSSADAKIEQLANDTIMGFMKIPFDKSVLSKDDRERFNNCISNINSSIDLDENIREVISVLKNYPISDLQILLPLISNHAKLGISREEFIKKYLFIPYYNYSDAKLIEAPKDVDPAEKEHPEDDKPEDIKMIEAPKHKKQENKQDSVKQKAVTKGAAKDMNGNITATDILNSCNAHSQQHKMQQAKTVEHGPNCNCGHCGEQNNNQVPQVHPELTLDKKVELLKSHIDFSVIKNFTVKEWEVDNLLQFVESPILKQKLREMGSACNPDFPKLTMSKKYKFDKNLYKFAFYAETNDKNKVIVVLYNTHMTLNPQFGLCNEMAFTLVPVNHVK